MNPLRAGIDYDEWHACAHCRRRFEGTPWQTKYCSRRCRSKAQWQREKAKKLDALVEGFLRIRRNNSDAIGFADEIRALLGRLKSWSMK